MTLVTGTVQDLGHDGMEGTLWARPARFRSDGQVVYAPERKPYKVVDGVVSADLAPGPAVLELQVGSHARGTFEVVIPEEDTTLADLLDTVFAWEPAQVSLFVAEREAAERAKADAEQAATLAGTAKTDAEGAASVAEGHRQHVDDIRETLDEAAQSNVAPYLTQSELNATYVTPAGVDQRTAVVHANATTGLIPDEDTDAAAATNTAILNDLLNNNKAVKIDGNYWVNSITVTNPDVAIYGNPTLNNRGAVGHVLRFNSTFHIFGNLYIHGWWKNVDGLVTQSIVRTSMNNVRVRGCSGNGVSCLPVGNSNSVTVGHMRTEENGVRHVTDMTVRTKGGGGFTARSTLGLATPVPTELWTEHHVKGLVVAGVYYEVMSLSTDAGTQVVEVRPSLPQAVDETVPDVMLLVGGGLYIASHSDSNWWNFQHYVSTDRSIGAWFNPLFGPHFDNVLLEAPRVGMVFSTKRVCYGTYIGHPYVELGKPDIPFVTHNGNFVMMQPLDHDNGLKIFRLFGNLQSSVDLTSGVIVTDKGVTVMQDAALTRSTSEVTRTLLLGQTMTIRNSLQSGAQVVQLRADPRFGGSLPAATPARLIYFNASNKDVQFTAASGYTVEGQASKTYTSVAGQRYTFTAMLNGTDWLVMRQVGD